MEVKKEDVMHKKIISIIAALLLMISTFVPFAKVSAQGLVEYAIILSAGVVAFNKNTESGEIVWVPGPNQANSRPSEDPPLAGVVFILTDSFNPTCTQTLQAQVETPPGLNVMTVEINGANKLVVNGKEVEEELDGCFGNADRVSIAVGEPVPPGSDPTALPAIPPHFKVLTVSVVDKVGGGTKATSSWIGPGANAFFHEATSDVNP